MEGQREGQMESGDEMKALSIRQPWVWGIMSAGKKIENREWPTKYRGTVLIHAAKGLTKAEYAEFVFWWEYHFKRRPLATYPKCPPMDDLPRGGIVGRARIVDCIEASTDPWFMGRYGFVLADVDPIPFIPYKGALGLFDVPDEVVRAAA